MSSRNESDTCTGGTDRDGTLVRVHTNTGKEGVIVELRPEEHDYPDERDMQDLTDAEARDLYEQLGDYLREPKDRERPCPDCDGRQIILNTERGDPMWVCSDTHCDRKDRYVHTGTNQSGTTEETQ